MTASFAPWPEPGGFRGLLAEPDGRAAIGTAIVFHGNAGHAGHRSYYAEALNRLGLRVILAEYPGYGPRPGKPGEEALVDDAADTIAAASSRYGKPIVVVGESLGAAVAASASARDPERVAGLLLITPWDRLEHVAAHHYPWLPVRWLIRDRYDTVGNLRDSTLPVVIVLAEHDEIVPARLGRALHEALARPHELVVIPQASHNDWIARVDHGWWRNALAPLLPGEPESAPFAGRAR
jgi:pimeloyl-ACP methyl ester carboxylesterase